MPPANLNPSGVLPAILLAAALCLPVCTSCNGAKQAPGAVTGSDSRSMLADLSGPGIDFTRRSVGLQTATLDYTGTAAAALAGAKQSAEVFFGESERGDVKLFHRVPRAGTRKYVTEIKQYHDGSMAAAADGSKIVYCRFRRLGDLIDDPYTVYPDPVAVTYSFDVKAGKEQLVFDFGKEEFRPWRANGVQPFISTSGETIAQLAYDADVLLLLHQSQEWLKCWLRLKQAPDSYSTEEREQDEAALTGILELRDFRAALKAAGLSEEQIGPNSSETHSAILKLNAEAAKAKIALLRSSAGTSTAIPVSVPGGYEQSFFFIAAMGDSAVVLCAEDATAEMYEPQSFFLLDIATGELSKLGELSGASKLFALSPDEKELRVVYSPIDPASKVLAETTHLASFGLGNGAQHDGLLLETYFGGIDLSADGRWLAGQETGSYNIYLVDCTSGERELISEQLSPATGLFLDDKAETLVYMSAGVTYWVDLSSAGRQTGRVEASEFAEYTAIVRSFMQGLGFDLNSGPLNIRCEERKGLAAHEVAVEFSKPGDFEKAILLRIDVKSKQVVSLWLPTGYVLPAAAHLTVQNLDYYDAERLARDLLDRAGWIPADKRVLYQPGPNPLYDQRTDSYVIIFREKYQLASHSDVAYATEASVRIGGGSGALMEMTLTLNEQVQRQPVAIDRSRLDFIVRNIEDTALPEDAPVKVDSENARLMVYTKRSQETQNGVLVGKAVPRLSWEVDTLLEPEGDLVFTNLIDTETGEQLGSLSYMPMAPTATTTER